MTRTNTAYAFCLCLLAIALITQLCSCKKASIQTNNPKLEGTWQWSQTLENDKTILANNYKTIEFQSKGHYTIAVNGNTHETGNLRFFDAPFGWNFEIEFRRNELLYDQQDYKGLFFIRFKGKDTLEFHKKQATHMYIRKKQHYTSI